MISGFFDPSQPPHPYVNVAIYLGGVTPLDQWHLIPFLVDTGASQTVIHPKDAIRRLGLSIAQLTNRALWANVQGNQGVGGEALSFECEAGYALQDADSGWRQTPPGKVRIAEMTPANQHFPSLLGWDLLRFFSLRIDGNPQSISLEWL